MKFADPKNDLAFKKIFGDKNKKEILISFLNSILDFKDDKIIVDIDIVNPYQVPKIEELKETILDIKATNRANENFIVEIQKKDLGDFHKRTLYYTSKAYVEQLNKGNDYSKLKKVYFIGILNFDMFDSKEYVSRHLILNKETLKQDLDDFEFSFIELKKFNKNIKELETILDKWIFFLKNASSLEMIPKEFENIKELKEAFLIATQYKWNKKELEIYDYMKLKEFDEINARKTAVLKAEKRGEERGEKKGEKKAKIEIAKNSLSQGIDIETIALITGLSKEEIEELKAEK